MTSAAYYAEIWSKAKATLACDLAGENFDSWFRDVECIGGNEDTIVLTTPSPIASYWICDNYSDVLAKDLALAASRSMKFEIRVDTSRKAHQEEEPHNSARTPASCAASPRFSEELFDPSEVESRTPKARISTPAREEAKVPSSINPRNTFETFVVGEGNKFAHAMALAVAQNPGKSYNPLFIYGATGLGKTHLMHAIAHFVLKTRPEAKVVYISSEQFVNEFITAIKDNSLTKFRRLYRNTDVLLIDDVQFFAKKESCQEEFFHTFNELSNNGKQIVLSCDRPLNEVTDITERLVTRFGWGMPADIQAPDYETRMAILQRKRAQAGANMSISDEAIEFIAGRFTKNIRRLEGALNKLIGYASVMGGGCLDAAKARDLLSDALLVEDGNLNIDIEQIQKKVSEFYKIDPALILGRSRTAKVAIARQIAMYLSRKLTTHTLEEIGLRFGGKKHGTVIHAHHVVEDEMKNNSDLRRAVEYLEKTFSL